MLFRKVRVVCIGKIDRNLVKGVKIDADTRLYRLFLFLDLGIFYLCDFLDINQVNYSLDK